MKHHSRQIRILVYVALLSAILTVAIACGSDSDNSTATPDVPTAATSTVSSARTATPTRVSTATSTPQGTTVSATVTRPTPTSTVFVPQPSSTPAFGRELLANGSFEREPFVSWEPRLSVSQLIEINGNRPLSGENSLHLMTPPDEMNLPRVILRERFPTEAGSDFLLKLNVIQSSQGPVRVFFDFYDGAGEFIERKILSERVDSGDDWIELSGIFTAPDGSATGLLILQLQIQLDSELPRPDQLHAWVDDVSVRKASE